MHVKLVPFFNFQSLFNFFLHFNASVSTFGFSLYSFFQILFAALNSSSSKKTLLLAFMTSIAMHFVTNFVPVIVRFSFLKPILIKTLKNVVSFDLTYLTCFFSRSDLWIQWTIKPRIIKKNSARTMSPYFCVRATANYPLCFMNDSSMSDIHREIPLEKKASPFNLNILNHSTIVVLSNSKE